MKARKTDRRTCQAPAPPTGSGGRRWRVANRSGTIADDLDEAAAREFLALCLQDGLSIADCGQPPWVEEYEVGIEASPAPAPVTQSPPDEPTIRAAVRAYILAEFLPGEDPAELKDDIPLVTGGILDERGVYRVHRFLADTFGVHLPADRFPWASFDSVTAIARMVVERLAAQQARGDDR